MRTVATGTLAWRRAFAVDAGAAPPTQPADVDRSGAYRPGACNIGPAEIARRRRAGHVGAAITLGLLAVLVGAHAPAPLRSILLLPAAGAASGYLQAWLHFCAGFGARGVFNFGDLGRTDAVVDPEARVRDRALAGRIGIAAAGVGIIVALVAVLLPV
jgi:hypothetical protein